MGNEECRDHCANNSQCPSHKPVVFRLKANIKDRQSGGQEKAVDHPHQDQNLNDNGYGSQCCSSVSDVRISLNLNPAWAGSVPTPFKNLPNQAVGPVPAKFGSSVRAGRISRYLRPRTNRSPTNETMLRLRRVSQGVIGKIPGSPHGPSIWPGKNGCGWAVPGMTKATLSPKPPMPTEARSETTPHRAFFVFG